jgi:hypothetical protein
MSTAASRRRSLSDSAPIVEKHQDGSGGAPYVTLPELMLQIRRHETTAMERLACNARKADAQTKRFSAQADARVARPVMRPETWGDWVPVQAERRGQLPY